jgi:hypothetical protein
VLVAACLALPAFGAKHDLTLVNRAEGTGDAATGGNSEVIYSGGALSRDGRYVVFDSEADNLSTSDDDDFKDVFLRDAVSGTSAARPTAARPRARTPPRRRSRPTAGVWSSSPTRTTSSRGRTRAS